MMCGKNNQVESLQNPPVIILIHNFITTQVEKWTMLAVDIETTSLKQNPNFRDTNDWKLVAVGMGHRGKSGEIETEVMFKRYGKGMDFLLVNGVGEWMCERGGLSKPTLTYNGTRYDEIHLKNWDTLSNNMEKVFQQHIDLCKMVDGSLEEACRSMGIEVEETYYDDYSLPNEVYRRKPSDRDYVTGKDVGEFLGEIYLDAVEHIYENDLVDEGPPEDFTDEYMELHRMLEHYAEADIRPLFELHDTIH